MRYPSRLIAVALTLALSAASVHAGQTSRSRRSPEPVKSAARAADDTPALPQAKIVPYSPQDLVPVRTRVRFVTLIVLPEGEQILEVACGDKEYWSVTGTQNLAYVKPAQEGLKTNLNLVTQSGRIFSFILTEGGPPGVEPDLKVVIELREGTGLAGAAAGTPTGASGAVKFVAVREVEELRRELEAARADASKARQEADAAVAAGIRKAIGNLRFAYRFEAGKRPFNVRAMGHDERMTYIFARPDEAPVLWEIRDKKPNLVDWTYDGTSGVYVASRVLGKGYLAIGKARLAFEREE